MGSTSLKGVLEGGPIEKSVVAVAPQPLLSDREMQVLDLLAKGSRRKEIAEQLRINKKTVTTYRTRLMQKLNVRTTVELIRQALNEGLVD